MAQRACLRAKGQGRLFVPFALKGQRGGFRGLAIALVMLHRFWPRGGILQAGASCAHLGWIGVDLFFVISGFLIAGILLDARGDQLYYRNFWAQRALRIFPLYYGFLLIAFVAIPATESGEYWSTPFLQQSGSPLWYVLYASNWREAFAHEPPYVLGPLWSLAIEEQFYLTFPIIVAACSRRQLTIVVVLCILLAPAFRIATMSAFPDNERIQYLATFSRVDAIAWGALLALGVRSGRLLPAPTAVGRLACGALAACVVAFALGGLDRTRPFCRSFGYSLVDLTFAMVVLWAVMNRETRQTAWLRFGPLCKLGTVCYGVYLLQRPAEVILLRVLGHSGFEIGADSLVLMFAKCAAAIGMASLSWHVFEQPILGLKRHFTSRAHPSPSTASCGWPIVCKTN